MGASSGGFSGGASGEASSRVRYYRSFDDDFSENRGQDFRLPRGYKFSGHSVFWKLGSLLLYPITLLIALIYEKCFLHARVRFSARPPRSCFLYGNHTQTLGDVLMPFLICFPHRPKIICAPANLGIPVIGKLLPLGGALPIPDNLSDLKRFEEAVLEASKKHPIVIYPEGHLWPYYTGIRPLKPAAFHYQNTGEAFVATTTYQRSRFRRGPKITLVVDGPIGVQADLSRKERQRELQKDVLKVMERRAKESDYDYIIYKKSPSGEGQ